MAYSTKKMNDLRRISLKQDYTTLGVESLDSELILVENYNGTLGFFNEFMGRWYDLVEINSSTDFNYKTMDATVLNWLSVGNAEKVKTITITFEEFALNGMSTYLSPIRKMNTENFVNSVLYVVRGDEEFYAKCEVTSFNSSQITLTCCGEFISPLYKCKTVFRNNQNVLSDYNNMPYTRMPNSLISDMGLMYISPYDKNENQIRVNNGAVIKTQTNATPNKLFYSYPNLYGLTDVASTDLLTYADYLIPYVPNVGFSPRYIHKYQRMALSSSSYPVATHSTGARSISITQAGDNVTLTGVKKFILSTNVASGEWYQWAESSLSGTTYDYSSETISAVKYAFFCVRSNLLDIVEQPYYMTNFVPMFPSAITNPPKWEGSNKYNADTYNFTSLNAKPTDYGSFGTQPSGYPKYSWQKLRFDNRSGKSTTEVYWQQVGIEETMSWSDFMAIARYEIVRCVVTLKYNSTEYKLLAFNAPWISVGMNEMKKHFRCHTPLKVTSGGTTSYKTRIYCGSTSTECSARKVMYSAISTRNEDSSTQNKFLSSNTMLTMSSVEDSAPIMLFFRNDYLSGSTGASHSILNPLGDVGACRVQDNAPVSVYPQINPISTDTSFRYVNSGNFELLDYGQMPTLTKFLLCPFDMYNTRAVNLHEETQIGATQENFLDVPSWSPNYPINSDTNVNFTFSKYIPRDELCRYENVEFKMLDVL